MTVLETVALYYDAWQNKRGDFSQVPLADDFEFVGPVVSFDNAEGYRAMATEAGQAVTSFAVRRQFVDEVRGELQLHCYRILGSVQDAEDLVQETLLAAWRGHERFEGRSSLRTWLYRIATNRSLNALRDRSRRPGALPTPPDGNPY